MNRDLGILILGVIIGGLAIGLLDSNRPKPLFSDAMNGGDNYEACLEYSGHNQMQSEIDDFISAQQGQMTPATIELVNRWLAQLNLIAASCNQIEVQQ